MKIDVMEDQIRKLHEKFYQTVKDKTHCLDRDEILSKMKPSNMFLLRSNTHWNSHGFGTSSHGNENLVDKIHSRELFQVKNKNFPFFSIDDFMVFLGDSILFVGAKGDLFEKGSTFIHEFYTLEEVIKNLTDSKCVSDKNGVKTLMFVKKKYKIVRSIKMSSLKRQ